MSRLIGAAEDAREQNRACTRNFFVFEDVITVENLMSTPDLDRAQSVLQDCLGRMTPDMRDAFLEVLEWMSGLHPDEQKNVTLERIQLLVDETFRFRHINNLAGCSAPRQGH